MNSDTKKILILCNDFPPINSIGAERPYSWYLYFKEFGLDPVVITKNWLSDGNDGTPLISQNTEFLVTDLGTIIKVKESPTISTKFLKIFKNRFKRIRQFITFIEIIFNNYVLILDRHRTIYQEAEKYLSKNKIDLLITTGEPFILFVYGEKLSKKFNLKWIPDYRDGWYLNHKYDLQNLKKIKKTSSRLDIIKNLIDSKYLRSRNLKLEKKIMKQASVITTVDPEMARRLSILVDKHVEVVYNGFLNYHNFSSKNLEKQKLIFSHTGTLAPGQQLELLLDAIKELAEENLINQNNFRLNLVGLEYFTDRLSRLKPYQELVGKLIFTTPRLPKLDAVKINLESDFLINFTDPSLSAIYAKTYDYIACRKPILVIPGDNKLLDQLVIKNNLGFILNSKEEIKSFIVSPPNYSLNIDNLDFFSRKHQTSIFSKIIYRTIKD